MKRFYKHLTGRSAAFFSLTLLAVVSCTYDYFVDETNFLVEIPQITSDPDLRNVLVVIHNGDSYAHPDKEHVFRAVKFIAAPFDPNKEGKDGILRFKVPAGRTDQDYNYKVSCFANLQSADGQFIASVDEAAVAYRDLYHSECHIYEENLGKNPTFKSGQTQSTVYRPRPDFRVFLSEEDVPAAPIGAPNTNMPFQADLGNDRRCRGGPEDTGEVLRQPPPSGPGPAGRSPRPHGRRF